MAYSFRVFSLWSASTIFGPEERENILTREHGAEKGVGWEYMPFKGTLLVTTMCSNQVPPPKVSRISQESLKL